MELQYYGANCLRITTKQAGIVIDDNLEALGLKSATKPNDVVFFTSYGTGQASDKAKLVINQAGEYEVSQVAVQGIPARSHLDAEGQESATMFKLISGDIRVAVTGHIHPDLDENQLEALGTVDVLVIPVGGNGYTLDAKGALKVIKNVEPKIVIPVHFADKAINYEVPQAELADALKEMSLEPKEEVDKLKLKSSELPESMETIILNRQ